MDYDGLREVLEGEMAEGGGAADPILGGRRRGLEGLEAFTLPRLAALTPLERDAFLTQLRGLWTRHSLRTTSSSSSSYSSALQPKRTKKKKSKTAKKAKTTNKKNENDTMEEEENERPEADGRGEGGTGAGGSRERTDGPIASPEERLRHAEFLRQLAAQYREYVAKQTPPADIASPPLSLESSLSSDSRPSSPTAYVPSVPFDTDDVLPS